MTDIISHPFCRNSCSDCPIPGPSARSPPAGPSSGAPWMGLGTRHLDTWMMGPPLLCTLTLIGCDGRKASLKISPTTTLSQLKGQIQQSMGIPTSAQVLYLGNKNLQEADMAQLTGSVTLVVAHKVYGG